MPTGRFHPYWKPGIKGICYPFENPAVLKSVYTNRKNGVCIYTSQNTKSPQSILRQGEERLWGLSYAAFMRTREKFMRYVQRCDTQKVTYTTICAMLPPAFNLVTTICLSMRSFSSATWEMIPTNRFPSVRPASVA